MRQRPENPKYSRYAVGQIWIPTKTGSHLPPRTIIEIGPTQNAFAGEIFYKTATQGRSVSYEKWEDWVTRQKAVLSGGEGFEALSKASKRTST